MTPQRDTRGTLEKVADAYIIEMMLHRGDGNPGEVGYIVRFMENYVPVTSRRDAEAMQTKFYLFYKYFRSFKMFPHAAIAGAKAMHDYWPGSFESGVAWLEMPNSRIKHNQTPFDELAYGSADLFSKLVQTTPVAQHVALV